MEKIYKISCFILLTIMLSACSEMFSGYKQQMQFEIVDESFNKSQLEKIKEVVQKRLAHLGGRKIEVTGKKEKITVNYEIGSDSLLVWRSFQMPGKLEFFEVCSAKEELYDHLKKTFKAKDSIGENEQINVFEFLGIMPTHENDDVFAYVERKNKARVESLLLNRNPVYVKSIKKRVKFLLGKPDGKDRCLLYAVAVTSENKSPLTGDCITEASSTEAHFQGNYVINFQMNPEGALIWERLTEKAYQTRGFIAIVIDDLVYSAPSVSSGAIKGGRCQISGNFTKEEAALMASVISSGSLPKIKILKIESRK